MEKSPIRVLLVEDDADDYLLTRDLLAEIQSAPFTLAWDRDYDRALTDMTSNSHDVCLVDYRLGARTGLDLLRQAIQQGCQAPIILLTGQGERAVDLEAMKAGAADFLAKGEISAAVLDRAIRYALERQRDRHALQEARDDLERRVQERTAELEQANDALRAEIYERHRAREALREADRRKDEFLAMLAHELRNPLAPIRNGLHILRMPNVDVAISERVRLMMEQQVHNLTRLVDDLLDVSRITRGKIHLRKDTIDLAAVINHAVSAARPLIELQQHTLSVTLPLEPIFLTADPTRLEQVITNLLGNAAKYTEPGGQIRLTVEHGRDTVIVRVRDTGIGISEQLMPRIFDMFTQADRTLDRSQGGLGIGLTLVRRLVELHGGDVEAHSDGPGRGSEFVVRLPAPPRQLEPPAPPTPAPAQRIQQQPLRVLVVEDETAVADMFVMLLTLWGHTVRAVHDGQAALAAVPTLEPDIILCDIGLPGMNGYQLAPRLRQLAGTQRVPLVAITGYGQEEDRRRAVEAGFDCHMTKPVDPTALATLLASLSPSCSAAK